MLFLERYFFKYKKNQSYKYVEQAFGEDNYDPSWEQTSTAQKFGSVNNSRS